MSPADDPEPVAPEPPDETRTNPDSIPREEFKQLERISDSSSFQWGSNQPADANVGVMETSPDGFAWLGPAESELVRGRGW